MVKMPNMIGKAIRSTFVCLLVGGEASAQQGTKPYAEGQIYAVGDVVALPEGNAIAVEIVKPKGPAGEGGSLSLKIKISGPLQVIAFTFGQDKSTITLGGGEKVVAATAASFAMNEVAATPSGPQLVSRMRTGADTGILVLDTNEHPLVVEFPIGPESTRGSMQLELKEFGIGRQKYSLKYTLPRANAGKPSADASRALSTGETILADTEFFPLEFSEKLKRLPAGKGAVLDKEIPDFVQSIKKKYGEADDVKVGEMIEISGFGTILSVTHYYGGIGFGAINEKIPYVIRKKR